jgi:hypothetical protein
MKAFRFEAVRHVGNHNYPSVSLNCRRKGAFRINMNSNYQLAAYVGVDWVEIGDPRRVAPV